MIPVAKNGIKSHFVYSTASKVIGMGCFPLTGNPSEVMGLVAHPSNISGIALSHDGKYLFSTGGGDLSAYMWAIDTEGWTSQNENENGNFLNLLDGGENGEMHNDIKDYFYYCQIRADGEDNMDVRNLTGKIPLEELPSLVRAIGFYPTEEEIANMVNEVRYKSFMMTGILVNDVDINTFIKLYVNHRPLLPLNNEDILSSFQNICASIGNGSNEITWADLKSILMSNSESMSAEDIEACLAALVGTDAKFLDDGVVFDAKTFADQILGFEDLGN